MWSLEGGEITAVSVVLFPDMTLAHLNQGPSTPSDTVRSKRYQPCLKPIWKPGLRLCLDYGCHVAQEVERVCW